MKTYFYVLLCKKARVKMSSTAKIVAIYEDWAQNVSVSHGNTDWYKSFQQINDFGKIVPLWKFRFEWNEKKEPVFHYFLNGGYLSEEGHFDVKSSESLLKLLKCRGIA